MNNPINNCSNNSAIIQVNSKKVSCDGGDDKSKHPLVYLNKKIGTTCRGIGPAYEDKVGRRAIRICDLKDENNLKERLENLVFYHNLLRRSLGVEDLTVNKIIEEINPIRQRLLSYTKPSSEITKILKSLKNVMFEVSAIKLMG